MLHEDSPFSHRNRGFGALVAKYQTVQGWKGPEFLRNPKSFQDSRSLLILEKVWHTRLSQVNIYSRVAWATLRVPAMKFTAFS